MTLPLDTAPGPTPDQEAARNQEISRHTLQQAREELNRGDLLQASEKAWCAAAYAVKAVAEKRRWFNDSDWKLGQVVEIVASEQADVDIRAYYLSARDAHFNFYHHEYDGPAVEFAIEFAGRLMDKLETILAPDYQPAFVSDQVEAMKRRLEQPTSEMDHQRLVKGRSAMVDRPPVIPREWRLPPGNGAEHS